MNNGKVMYLVNEEGEIINEINPKENRIVVQSLEDLENKGKALKKLENSKRLKYRFAKLNVLNVEEITQVAPFFIKLIPYISYFDNILRFDNGVKINPNNIGLVYGKISRAKAYRIVKILVDEDIIHKYGSGKNARLVVNPWICYCGKTIQADVADEFEETKWKRGDY